MTNYYKEFDLDTELNGKEICDALFIKKKSWNRKQNSPNLDKRQEAERMVVLIDKAMSIFSDENKRKQYDNKLKQSELQEQVAKQQEAQQHAARQQNYNQNQGNGGGYNRPPVTDTNRSPYGYNTTYGSNSTSWNGGMNANTTSIIAYLTIIGWLIAYFKGDKEGAKIHLNQCLVIFLARIICILASNLGTAIAALFGIALMALAVLWIIGFIYACKGEQKEIPLLGSIHVLK